MFKSALLGALFSRNIKIPTMVFFHHRRDYIYILYLFAYMPEINFQSKHIKIKLTVNHNTKLCTFATSSTEPMFILE